MELTFSLIKLICFWQCMDSQMECYTLLAVGYTLLAVGYNSTTSCRLYTTSCRLYTTSCRLHLHSDQTSQCVVHLWHNVMHVFVYTVTLILLLYACSEANEQLDTCMHVDTPMRCKQTEMYNHSVAEAGLLKCMVS